MNLQIRKTVARDIAHFEMLPEDIDEVWLSSRRHPLEALKRAVWLSSKSFTILQEGLIVAICGVGPLRDFPERGCIWCLRSVHIGSVSPRDYMEASKDCLAEFSLDFTVLGNMAPVKNTTTLRWLQKLGFTMGATVPVTHEGNTAQFKCFYKESR